MVRCTAFAEANLQEIFATSVIQRRISRGSKNRLSLGMAKYLGEEIG